MKIIVAAVVVWMVSGGAQAGMLDEQFAEETETYMSRLEKLGFAGVVKIAEKGEVVFANGYGLADREKRIPWTPRSISTVGSITKQFTAAAILVLQEKGVVDTGDGLDKHFSGVPADKKGITLHHLLTHSSGIVDPPDIDDFDPITRDQYVRRVLDAPLNSAPGERFEYANANYSLLGAIIEQKTGKHYEAAIRELVLDPAGLKETGYTLPDWEADRIAQGYEGPERWGTVLERPMADDGPYWALRANGGIYSGCDDMLRWARALLDDRVMTRASRELMWTPHVDETNGAGESWYGYGWVVRRSQDGPFMVTHNGGNGILFADFAIYPDDDVVMFLQTNVVADFRKANELLGEFDNRLFGGVPYPDVPDVVGVESRELEERAGVYRFPNGDRLDVSVDGDALRVVPEGWEAWTWVHSDGGVAAGPLLEKSRAVDAIVGAYTGGDFEPIYKAYREQVPIDRLRSMYEQRLAEREAEYGAYEGYEVLGTGTGDRYYFTMVRFVHERGSLLRTYVWAPGDEEKLLGFTTRRMDPGCRFYPVGEGLYRSWEPATGASVTARFEMDGRAASLVLIRDESDVTATRTPDAR